jgi:hypothetical protein
MLFVPLTACEKDLPSTIPTTEESEKVPAPEAVGDLRINEYLTQNSDVNYTSAGEYADWVELYNAGDADVALGGYFLSDDGTEPGKWTFPAGTVIEAGDYLLIWCSGEKKPPEGEIHASFKLGGDDTEIVLYSANKVLIDRVAIVETAENVSYGRSKDDPNQFVYYAYPTPAAQNGAGFEKLSHATGIESKTIYISEVSAAYARENKDKTQSDWIEIHNRTDKPVSLKGYGLCKDLKGGRLVFGDVTLAPDGYLVVDAVGKDVLPDDTDDGRTDEKVIAKPIDGTWTAPFQIDSSGDSLLLLNADGVAIDRYETGKLRVGESSGRTGDALDRVWFAVPTPGKENAQSLTAIAPVPVFSNNGGYASVGDSITIAVRDGFQVRFTTDGGNPTESSQIYSTPLALSETITIRARAFADGYLPSDTATASFIVGTKHEIPVVFLSSEPDNLFGYKRGIMADGPGYSEPFPYVGANFWKDWERVVTFEYYEANGEKMAQFDAGANVFGQYTRAYLQKSLALHLREDYGKKTITYPFFENNPVTVNTDFVLRAAGQDQYRAKLRDAFCTQVLRGYTVCVSMDWQPVALYINGAYWGLYALREKVNERFFAAREGLDPDNMDIIKGDTNLLTGDKTDWRALREYVKSHDLRVQANYDYVAARVDIPNFIDYLIAEIFFANSDTGNTKAYREQPDGVNGGSKWRWVLFDFDMTMRTGAMGPPRNTIKEMFNPDGHGYNHMFFTALQVGLLKNSDFKAQFKARYEELLNTAFSIPHMTEVLDRMAGEIEPEIAANAVRWGKPTVDYWQSQVDEIREIINTRPAVARSQMEAFLR